MTIINKNGTFHLDASQFNYLMFSFEFDDIDAQKVSISNFINSSWEYEKADIKFDELGIKRKNKL